ncbi:cellulase family glycosylhydrolase [Actibacterium sp. 188UL27-1]|uniref:cellulase family glycosylhydrolase n=1 Tax=Actibacterium sp. 188UL27-1 TaxID=2786961 RepID=UPI001957140D|nr:cellulase family glycosylhydrolase [Actibacterium sp. 188UL27-1]MBM7069426.1 cellulase family glycosylhydrolase [Actibacterium sp. 188UL27-1]
MKDTIDTGMTNGGGGMAGGGHDHDHGEGHDHGGGHMPANPAPGGYTDITAFGSLHGTSSHTHEDSLEGGRTPITTEALVSYNGLRAFLGLDPLELEAVGTWAYANQMTNDPNPYGQTLKGVGLYYGMQGAKVGWIADDAFDPQILADIQREARLGTVDNVMKMVEEVGLDGYAAYLKDAGLVDAFVNTLQMEPHYGGWMHGATHGGLPLDGAVAHDVNHLTVLSHDQMEPFMNDTFDYPQWSALDVPEADVANYFQSMVLLSDPLGEGIPAGMTGGGTPVDPDPVDPDPVDPDPVDPDPVDPDPVDPDTGGTGQTYKVGSTDVVADFDPAKDVLDLGSDSIHNQIGVDTADGFAMIHMFDSSKSLLLEGVFLKDLTAKNFAPIADSHLQQDLSASLAYENGTGLVRENTVYVRSHEAGLEEIVDFDPATDTVSMFYLSVRGDQLLNFVAEDSSEGARFFSPISGQSLTLRGVSLSELDSSHFEWRANQLEDNVAGRMGLAEQIDGFSYENVFSGKSVPMAGLVDRAPYHSQPDYTGTPIGSGSDTGGGDTGGGDTGGDTGGGDTGGGATITPTITSQWGSGFVAQTEFTPTQTVNGWTIQLRVSGDIGNIWNAKIVDQDGDLYTLTNESYNGAVAAGQTISFGFQASGSEATVEVVSGGSTGDPVDPDPVDPDPVDPDPVDPDPVDPDPVDPTMFSVSDASVTEGDPAPASDPMPDPTPPNTGGDGSSLLDGPLSTSGTEIVDAKGNAVQIRAANWFGGETERAVPDGLWQRPFKDMMDQMVDLGFNAIRLPFSTEGVLTNPVPGNVVGNPDLVGLTMLEVFDRIVDYAEEIGIKIILDNHRTEKGSGPSANGLWFNDKFSEADWIKSWEVMAERYGDSPAVIAADLQNEPHNGTWGDNSATDWAAAAERGGNAVLDKAPDWLIMVEGVSGNTPDGFNTWWGGNLTGVRDRPVELDADDKLVYSPHDYPASVFQQDWFTDGSNLYDTFSRAWGFIYEEGIAPIFLGEFGSKLENPLDLPWADAITNYLAGDFDGDGVNDLKDGQAGPSFAWWSWNPNSGDTGGILNDDWTTPRQNAIDLLAGLLEGDESAGPVTDPAPQPDADPVYMTFEVKLEEPATERMVFDYTTEDGTAKAGEDYVAASGTVVFEAGEQSKMVKVEVMPDLMDEPNEKLSLTVTASDGTAEMGTGTILDDDGGMIPDPIYPDPVDPDPVDPDPVDPDTGGTGQTYKVGSTDVVADFDPAKDVLDLGSDSIHNQIGVDTADGFAMIHMFDSSKSLLLEGVFLKDLTAKNFAPIADSHLQQDLSASLAYENGTGLVRENTVYVRSHEAGLEEIVDFDPATDTVSMFYLSVRGDQLLNFVAEDSSEGARFFSPISGQSLTLRGVSLSELDSSHFEWRANQLEDNVAGRMGLAEQIDGFSYENVFSGKSVPMAGLVDRAPYHSQPDYTGTPIGSGSDTGGGDTGGGDMGVDTGTTTVTVTLGSGSTTESDPGMTHVHDDGTSHVHDDGHRYILFNVSLDEPATEEVTLTYATADGTAVADTSNDMAYDYHEAMGTLVFAPGEQSKTVQVKVHPDMIVEDTETFTLAVSGENITGTLTATGTIYDNDVEDPNDGDMGGGDVGGDTGGGGHGGADGHVHGNPNDGSDMLDARLTVVNDWGSGANVELEITNVDHMDFDGDWAVAFSLDGEIVNMWNGSYDAGEAAGEISVSNASYNGSVAAGTSVTVGFQLNQGGLDQDMLNADADFYFV